MSNNLKSLETLEKNLFQITKVFDDLGLPPNIESAITEMNRLTKKLELAKATAEWIYSE